MRSHPNYLSEDSEGGMDTKAERNMSRDSEKEKQERVGGEGEEEGAGGGGSGEGAAFW